MQMQVLAELIGPALEDGNHARQSPEPARVFQQLTQRVPGRTKIEVHKQPAAPAPKNAQRIRRGENNLMMSAAQLLGALPLEPELRLCRPAQRTGSMLAGVAHKNPVIVPPGYGYTIEGFQSGIAGKTANVSVNINWREKPIQ